MVSLGLVIAFGVTLLSGCKRQPEVASTESKEYVWITNLVAAEDLILELTIELKHLNQSVKNLSLPDSNSRSLFSKSVELVDIDNSRQDGAAYPVVSVTTYDQKIAESIIASIDSLSIWEAALTTVEEIRDARFYFVGGSFENLSRDSFKTEMGFEGLAKLDSGELVAIKAAQDVTWSLDLTTPRDDPRRWRISHWKQTSFKTGHRAQLMFEDVMAEAIPDEDQANLLNSAHDEFIVKSFKGESLDLPFPEIEPYFTSDSTMCHPSLSVVDINDDGWDDLYVMTRWHKNRLFVNQKNGKFREIAGEIGLDIDRTSCALFADFDNDGDKDAFLGRCFASSLLLINEDGQFVDRTEDKIKIELPGFVCSISAADYDNDGLLDVYLSSYVPIGAIVQTVESASQFMPNKDAENLIYWFKRASSADLWLERPGPPNRLLHNVGNATFEESDAIEVVWRNTFQATWSDYDEDGDVDLYLSNDFAPDYLYRNDQQGGFTDVTEQAGGEAMRGYGMGVTWGDYDNDGWRDLYVSNMYSKAGKRIIGKMPGELDKRYLMSANGNRLFRNSGSESFELVSGQTEDKLHVTKAGWSWGGQFCDFDNDGFLDIYVASGFYTAPSDITCNVDL